MLRALWSRVSAASKKLLIKWKSRCQKRPGYFCIKNRRAACTKFLRTRLATSSSAACGVVILTVAAGFMGVDPVPVGGEGKPLVASRKGPEAPPGPEENTLQLEGDVALMLQVAMLQNAITRLDQVPSYSATFIKHERIDGALQEEQEMLMRLQHQPHKVFFRVMKGDVGREILFPIGPDDPRMIVKLPRFGFRLPPLKLEPESSIPMRESRYNIRMAGIKELTRLALEIRRQDLTKGNKVQCVARDDAEFNERPCFSFTTAYASPQQHKEYRKCIIYVDKQMMIPTLARNFTWPELASEADMNNLDATTLIEYYAFKDIKFESAVSDNTFLVENPEYKFGKQ